MQPDPDAILAPFIAWTGVFTPAELDAIVAYGDRARQDMSSTRDEYGAEGRTRFRVSRTAWLTPAPEIQWLYDRMANLAADVNASIYRFDLAAFSEPLQYAVYRGDEGGHFGWHMDQTRQTAGRKLSFTVQLSEAADYEGGDLQFDWRDAVDIAPKARGMIVAFPSYVFHRVTPVTAGVRRSLVAWITGPAFR